MTIKTVMQIIACSLLTLALPALADEPAAKDMSSDVKAAAEPAKSEDASKVEEKADDSKSDVAKDKSMDSE